MLKNILLIGLIPATLTVVGCTTTPTVKQQENLNLLQNKTWVLTHIGSTEYPSQTNSPIIQFSSDLRVSGSDGCNRIMGNYAVKDHHLNLGSLASTKMYCQDMTLVEKYTTALHKVTGYQSYDRTLKLVDQYGNVVLQYKTTP